MSQVKISTQYSLDFHNVLLKPKISNLTSRKEVDLMRDFVFRNSKQTWFGTPIIAANMDSIGTFEVYEKMNKYNMLTALHKFYTINDYAQAIDKYNGLNLKNIMISTGISDTDFIKLTTIMTMVDAKWICIDVANGHMRTLVDYCRKVRETYPDKIIVAGNVVSAEMVNLLVTEGGVDLCKVGIGSGAACITRMKAGVGVPQLSAILECAEEAHKLGAHIISDGGITCSGDMAKAFCAGADFVMCGGVFSGHDENPGELIEDGGQAYKLFYGMSSEHAMKKHYGAMEKYRSSEGRVLKVKYKGALEKTLLDYMGGLRSCCTYINASCISEMPLNAEFVLVTQQLNTSMV
jgi:GMP reductase